jgi:PAS domain S-box-containing protein
MHSVEKKRAEDELKKADNELRVTNEELASSNEELRASEEELKTQTEELAIINQALTDSEERYRHLIKYAPTGIYEVDFTKNRFTSVNDGMCRILGYTEEELLATSPTDILDDASKRKFLDRVRRAQTGEVLDDSVEYRVLKKDGSAIWGELYTRFIYKNGRIVGSFVVASDITERKRAEEALAEQKALVETILDQAMGGIMVWDTSRKLILINQEARNATGQALGDPVDGPNLLKLYDENGVVISSQDFLVYRALQGEKVTGIERQMVRSDGESYWVLSSSAPVRNKRGEIIAAVSTHTNITDLKKVEEENKIAQQRSDFLANLLEKSSQPFGVDYPDGRLGLVNEAFEKLTGYTREELTALDWAKVLTPPEWLESERTKLDELERSSSPVRYEKEYVRKDGSRVPIELLVNLVRDKEGRPLYYCSFITDITERKKADAEVARIASFPQFNPNPVMETDYSGDIQYINPASESEFPDVLNVGSTTPFELNWPSVVAQLKSSRERALTLDVEVKGVWYSLSLHMVPGTDRVRIYALNIDERKLGEKALRDSNEELSESNEELAATEEELKVSNEQLQEYTNRLEGMAEERTAKLRVSDERLRGFIDSTQEEFFLYDADLNLLDLNKAAQQLFSGKSREELIGKNITGLTPGLEKTDRYRMYKHTLETGEPTALHDLNDPIRLPGVWVDLRAFRVGDGVGVVSRDVTEQRLLEERLHRTEVIAAVEQMGATVAHDLRNPLGQIVQSIQMAKQDPSLTPRMLKLAEESAVRSLRMIADWRSSTREIVPQPVKTDLGALIKDVLGGTSIPVDVKPEMSIGEGFDSIRLDPDIMNRVLDNLVKNAVEAMPKGGKLQITAKREEDNIIFEVSDTGAGIPEESRGRIFSPLYTTKAGGMGLGLTYCRRAVEAMGGTINFESKVGVGTTFTMTLPLK